MTNRLQTRHASTAPARLSVAPLVRPLPPPPHLVAPEQAHLGDVIGVFGGICHRPDLGHPPETHIEVVYRQGVLGPETCFVDELSDADGATFREIAAVPFCGIDHHRIVRQAQMVDGTRPFQIHLIQFTDAILYVHPRWLQGVWGRELDRDTRRPLIMMLEGAHSMKDAARCLEKTKRYLKTFRRALPANVRTTLNRHLELPRPRDFLASGDAGHTFVR